MRRHSLGVGFKAKFVVKQLLVARELTHSLRHIAFGQEYPDESCVAGFPEWFPPHGSTGGARRLTPASGRREMVSECFQGMQAKLPPVLCLYQHPIVVPVGQQVGRQGHNGARAKIARSLAVLPGPAAAGRAL